MGIVYEGRSYTRKFEKYIESCIEWAKECHRVLKPDGNLWIVNYPRQNAYLRVRYFDEAFAHVYEYVWVYRTNIGQGPTHFTTAHRSILHCTEELREPLLQGRGGDAVSESYRQENSEAHPSWFSGTHARTRGLQTLPTMSRGWNRIW